MLVNRMTESRLDISVKIGSSRRCRFSRAWSTIYLVWVEPRTPNRSYAPGQVQ